MASIVMIIILFLTKNMLLLNAQLSLGEMNTLLCSEPKSDLFSPLNVIFCRLDHVFLRTFFQTNPTQTMLLSVTVNPRLCLTEEKSEIKEKISGGVPNDSCQRLTTLPLSREVCTWFCVLLTMSECVSSGHNPWGNTYTLATCWAGNKRKFNWTYFTYL